MKGVLYMFTASFLYGILPSFQRGLLEAGVSAQVMPAINYSVIALVSLVMVKVKGYSLRIPPRQLLQLCVMGALGMGLTAMLLSLSYTRAPVGLCTTIHFMYPSLVCISMSLLFKERMTLLKVGAIVCSVVGLGFLAGGVSGASLFGMLLAFCSGLSYAFAFVIPGERGSGAGLPQPVRTFYIGLSIAVCFTAVSLISGAQFPTGGAQWAKTLTLACGFSTAIYLIVLGISLLGATKAAFLNIVEPVTSLIFSALYLRYSLSTASIIGCALMLGSVFLITLGNSRETPS